MGLTKTGKACIGSDVAALLMTNDPAFATSQDYADAFFAAENWSAAAAACEDLRESNPANGGNWSNLAHVRHSAENFAGARALMAFGEQDRALAGIETIAGSGTPLGHAVQAASEYRAFDFWAGECDVAANGATAPKVSSRISAKHDGCVALEDYDAGACTGMNINFYDYTSGRWHRSWMANNGAPVYPEGNLDENGPMVLTDAGLPINAATGIINRVTWLVEDGGVVRQYWETSSDGGTTPRSAAFDGLYARRAGTTEQ